ncbi:MAG: helix-turn-helix transcriptional regulator [Elusimicrobia bacterium]|nr:helix-turn-helix transcriptional regulator [Elusimicrobiota bacterium]
MTERELLAVVAKGIRRCRKRLGLTIEQLAEAAGVDAGYLAHIEIARKTPSLALLARIISALRVRPEELFRSAGKDEAKSGDDQDKRVLAILDGMMAAHRVDALAILAKLRDPRQAKSLRRVLKA